MFRQQSQGQVWPFAAPLPEVTALGRHHDTGMTASGRTASGQYSVVKQWWLLHLVQGQADPGSFSCLHDGFFLNEGAALQFGSQC